jgi:hypothetical protein
METQELMSLDMELQISLLKVCIETQKHIDGSIKDINGNKVNYEMIFAADGPTSK